MPYNGKQVTDTVNKELFMVVLHREFSTETKKIHTFDAVLRGPAPKKRPMISG